MNKYSLLIPLLLFVTVTKAQRTIELSHYLFPEFTKGSVMMKDGTETSAMLNYNAVTREMIFQQNGRVLALADPTLSLTDTVRIEDRKFVLFDDEFVEVLLQEDTKLMTCYRCKIIPPGNPAPFGGTSQTSSVDNYSTYRSGNMVYELKLPDDYKIEPNNIYYLDNGSGWKKINSMRQLKKIYKKKKERFDQYVSEQKIQFNDPAGIAELVEWLERE